MKFKREQVQLVLLLLCFWFSVYGVQSSLRLLHTNSYCVHRSNSLKTDFLKYMTFFFFFYVLGVGNEYYTYLEKRKKKDKNYRYLSCKWQNIYRTGLSIKKNKK